MNEAFMLFFARNRVPPTDHYFYFATPHFEKHLNDKGRIRIDYQSAQPVAASEAVKNSRLLKMLAVGTTLDVEVVSKLNDLDWPSVESYWRSQEMYSGMGYILSPENQVQYDASFMRKLPNFIPPEDSGFLVDVSLLPEFGHYTAHMPRRMELYTPPFSYSAGIAGSFAFCT